TRKVPNKPVLAWNDFLTEAFDSAKGIDTNKRIYSRPDVTDEELLSVEDSVRLTRLSTPESWIKRYAFRDIKGQPDVIRCGAVKALLLKNASLLLSIVEIKTEQLMRTLVDDGTELFNAYNIALTAEDDGTTAYTRHQEIIRIVRQLFGYMVVNDLKYGLLTTYIRTWFFYCKDDNSDNIYISPTVHINQSHT
ncbi:18452_t:CDS:2, partial [Gigaspora margarita]